MFLFVFLALFLSESVAQNTYQVGDLFVDEAGNMGIVFYLLPNQTGGWVVALDDADSTYQWGGWGFDVPDIIQWNNNLTDTNGYGNTLNLRNFLQEDLSPYGVGNVDFQNGWYVPAINQLMWLFAQLPFIESKFSLYGGTTLSGSAYMSSSECSAYSAVCLNFQQGKASTYNKSLGRKLRAVRSFTYYTVNYDTSLIYHWSTGSTQPYITPSPPQTTTYTVTATNESGCSATASQTIFVAESPQQDFYDEVCQGEPYEANGFSVTASETSTPGLITRTRTVTADGCSTTLTLHLTVLPAVTTTLSAEACQSYIWNGVTHYESGIYEQHFPSANGCDSTVVLSLTLHSPDTTYLTEFACDSYILNGTTYSYSGTYTQYLTNDNGCDSVVVLNLTIHPAQHIVINTTVYDGLDFGGVHYSESGTYTFEYQSQYGCDSVVQLNLNVLHLDTVRVDSTVCEDALPLVWNGVSFFASGIQAVTLPSFQGYDSVVVMTLHVNATMTESVEVSACDSYVWAGETYTQSGTYTRTFANQQGCDSVVTLHLMLNHSETGHVEASACDSYEWAGETYTQSGAYTRIFTNQQGCDSTVTLTLAVNPSETSSFDTTVCESFLWNGQAYTQTGEYVQTLSNRFGCDSVVTAHLTVNYEDNEQVDTLVCPQSLPVTVRGFTFAGAGTQSITLSNSHGCDSTTTVHVAVSDTSTIVTNYTACNHYLWYGTLYTESGVYDRPAVNNDGCPITRRLALTVHYSDTTHLDSTCCQNKLPIVWNGRVFYAAGTQSRTFSTTHGCDSVVVMTVHVNNSSFSTFDTTVCGQFEWEGSVYTQGGTFLKTFSNVSGCESMVIAHVTVMQPPNTAFDTVVCVGDLPVTWRGLFFEHADTLMFTYTSALGCDSTVTFALRVAHPDTVAQQATVCDLFEWGGEEYFASDTLTEVFTNIHGCDSTVTIYLTVNSTPEAETFEATACDRYTWAGITYTASGNYTRTFLAANGCDSTVTLHLTVNPSVTELVDTTICEDELPYTWNGLTFNAVGTQSVTLQTVEGCDSLVSMTLHVANRYQQTQADTICEDELPYLWNGLTFNAAGTKSVTLQTVEGCDSVVSMTLHVANRYNLTQTETICEDELPYQWNGLTFNAAGAQTVTLQTAEGCDSVVTMALFVNPTLADSIEAIACDSYTWDSITYTTSGDYTRTFTAANGCDSTVTLHLTVNPSVTVFVDDTICEDELPYTWNGLTFNTADTQSVTLQTVEGCDSVVTMTLHVVNRYNLTQTDTICEDELPYQWNGLTFNAAGTQCVTLQTVEGCDSVLTMILHVANRYNLTQTDAICEDELPYQWNGLTFNAAGTQSVTLQTVEGCDSVVSMTLHVANRYNLTQRDTICEDELPYHWNGLTFNAAGTQSVTLQTVDGCDSVVTMILHVANRYNLTQEATICEDALPYHWNGLTFNAAGTQTVTLQTVEGCDSVVSMTLHVANQYDLTQTVTICENELPYLWNGLAFTEAGTQSVTLQTVEGCDSVVTMTLVVNPTVADSVEATACDSYVWADETFTESGDYMRTFTTSNGCDSTVTLHLTVHPSVTEFVEATACDSYTWNGETYYESGDYDGVFATVHGCDSTVILHLTVIDTTLGIISLTEDFCESMSMELAAVTAMTDYHWSTGEESPNIAVTQPGIYSVTASQGGCRATAKYAVAGCDFHLWLPNAITPSKNDGLNDVFCLPLRAQSMIVNFEISIFDRWGEQVFYSTDKAFQWDGSVDGKTAVNAVYNYVIRYTLVGGKPLRANGSVTVL